MVLFDGINHSMKLLGAALNRQPHSAWKGYSFGLSKYIFDTSAGSNNTSSFSF